MKINPKKMKSYQICNGCLENIKELGTNWSVFQNETIFHLGVLTPINGELIEECRICGKIEPLEIVAIIEGPSRSGSVKPFKYHSIVTFMELIQRKIDSRNPVKG